MEGVGTFTSNPRFLVGDAEYEMIAMYRRCDMGMAGRVWPDGKAYLDQPNILIEAFATIATALHDFDPKRDA